MRKSLIGLAVFLLLALLAAPASASEVALIVVDTGTGTVVVTGDDPTGNAPPPLVVIKLPSDAEFDNISPPTQDGVGCAPPQCD